MSTQHTNYMWHEFKKKNFVDHKCHVNKITLSAPLLLHFKSQHIYSSSVQDIGLFILLLLNREYEAKFTTFVSYKTLSN